MPVIARTMRLLGLILAVAAATAWSDPVSAQTPPYVPVAVPPVVGPALIVLPAAGAALPGSARRAHVQRSVSHTRDRGHVVLK